MNTNDYPEIVPAGDGAVFLTSQHVRAKVGGVSAMTLHRWLRSDAVRFPQPTLRINNRRYWSASSIRRWLAERSSQGTAA
jgi:hypothetical protein